MSLKKRAIKSYQEQLALHPLPRRKPVNLPVKQTKEKSYEQAKETSINPYDNWYHLPEEERPKAKKHPLYARYRNLAILDMVFKVVIGLVLIGMIINLIIL